MPKPTVLIVDDQEENRLILEDLLFDEYEVINTSSGTEALEHMQSHPVQLVLLDIVMPDMNGYEVCEAIRSQPQYNNIPIIFITALDSDDDETKGLSLGAQDFIHKPFSPAVVAARVKTHWELAKTRQELAYMNAQLENLVCERTETIVSNSQELIRKSKKLEQMRSATIAAFCTIAEFRDNESSNHIFRIQAIIYHLGSQLLEDPKYREIVSETDIQRMVYSSPLHDIGKVAIPDSILMKPDRLNDAEWEIMKHHSEYGRSVIHAAISNLDDEEKDFLTFAEEIAYSHHERWDGTGYPNGLKGEEIPLSARLMAIADVYDALTTTRPYKDPYAHDVAIRMIDEASGSHFDPHLVEVFMQIADELRDVIEQMQSNIKPVTV